MKTETIKQISVDRLIYLPSYAQYLLESRLEDYVQEQKRLTFEIEIPLMKFFRNMPEEQFNELLLQSATEMLTFLKENKASQYIQVSLDRWKENQLPVIDRSNIVAEDITLSYYMRRKILFNFLTDYTKDPEEMMDLISEIDFFVVTSETASTNLYINLLQERIAEHSHFIEKVNNTIPGAVYVFDVEQYKNIYSNKNLAEVIGYGSDELNALGENAIITLIAPADQPRLQKHIQDLKTAKDGEVKTCKYRIKDKSGKYKWLTNFDSVFKRSEDGKLLQTIGITLDTTSEEMLYEQLQQQHARFQQAEAITRMGNYVWYLDNNHLEWSDELYRIHGFDANEPLTYKKVEDALHPDDKNVSKAPVKRAIEGLGHFDFYYRIIRPDKEERILHARGEVVKDENNAPVKIIGTVQDVTERQLLIRKLRHSEKLYRQAEELAHMGTWSLHLQTGKAEWTDQLYKIYGMKPQCEEVTVEKFLGFIYPADKSIVEEHLKKLGKEDHFDNTFRIIAGDGKLKWLRSIGQLFRNEKGEPEFIVGTERDVTDKLALIAQLRESEELYKQAQSLAKIGNWTLDIEKKILTWSDEMFRIFEIEKRESITVDEWAKLLHPQDRELMLQQQEKCIREGKEFDVVHRIAFPGDRIKVTHRKGQLVYNEKGIPIKMIGTTQDITEQYQIQQVLKENQTFIQKITDATPSIISSYNVNSGKYVYISEGMEKLLGYSPEVVMEKGFDFFTSIIHADDAQQILQQNAKVLADANADPDNNDIIAEFTYRMRHKNGEYRWFHTYGTVFDRNSEGKVEHVLNITLDVTQQQLDAEKIKEQEHFIQQIADASPTILYLLDAEKQQMVYINREIFFVLGYTPEEIIEMKEQFTEKLYHPDDYGLLPERRQTTKRFQRIDSMIQYECRMKHKDGEWRWFLVREIVFKTAENGNITQILGAALDINRRKEMEKTILQNTMKLEQSNASLEEFAYVASHDLKEPLRKISTFGDRLVATQEDKLSEDGKIYLRKIVDASQRMQTMISDLLSISMITGNKSFEPYSLQKVLDEVMQTLEYKIEQQNAIIKYEQLPSANIIPSQFRQLFQNLLSNSLKFVKEGRQPVIAISHKTIAEDDVRQYGLRSAGPYHKITLTDNGIGFENEFAGKIFAIFQRLHGRSEYEGSGIGLAICKKIAEHHGGVIFATGVPDEGATFTIILPA